MQQRKYQLILMGATGFTGQLVAEYLNKQYGVGKTLHWAIAGRNKEKLEQVKTNLNTPNLPIIVADSLDPMDLEKLAQQTKVVCSTVGPYATFGSPLVAACVQHRTDYCDITGEVPWMRRMIDQHHDNALNKGTRIVHTCGFDSIPFDMGVFFLQKEIFNQTGQYANQIKCRLKGARGGFSGGTVASLQHIIKEAALDPSVVQILSNPYGLNPNSSYKGLDQPDLKKVVFDEDLQAWIGPFIMATINTKVVRRSHALAEFPYGPSFQYDEATYLGKDWKAKTVGNIMSYFLRLLETTHPETLRGSILNWFMPKPGQGPSKQQRENGYFKVDLLGILKDGQQFQCSVRGDRDPGYGSTAKMLAESAVCLALDGNQLPPMAGVITPSTALGVSLLRRLQENAGLSFKMH